jgi:hypothetical protein
VRLLYVDRLVSMFMTQGEAGLCTQCPWGFYWDSVEEDTTFPCNACPKVRA